MLDDLAVALIRRLPKGQMFTARLLAKIKPSLRSYPAVTRYGTIYCDISESACFGLYAKGEILHWRADESGLASLPLTKDSVVLDIGANIGVLTSLFARRAGHVHAFEPAPRALRLLRMNSPPNVTIHPVAVSDNPGTVRFEEREALDMSSVGEQGAPVPAITIDSLKLAPDFIKIDVEGYEPQVLRGAAETIRRHRPIIMFEALDTDSFEANKEIILSICSDYRFEPMGGGTNFIARTS